MGPGDPFGNEAAAPTAAPPNVSKAAPRTSHATSGAATPRGGVTGKMGGAGRQDATDSSGPALMERHLACFILVGVLVGIAFGLVVVLRGFGAALVLGVFGCFGAGLAAAIWAAASGRVDLAAAWAALFRRGSR